MRTITVYNTKSNTPATFESDATTYGEVKQQILASAKGETMRVVVRETKVTLEATDAQLPEADFTVFLFPVEMKSGWDYEEADGYEEEEEDYITKMDVLNNKVEDLKSTLSEIYDILLSTVGANNPELMAKVEENKAKKELADKLAAEAANFKF